MILFEGEWLVNIIGQQGESWNDNPYIMRESSRYDHHGRTFLDLFYRDGTIASDGWAFYCHEGHDWERA